MIGLMFKDVVSMQSQQLINNMILMQICSRNIPRVWIIVLKHGNPFGIS